MKRTETGSSIREFDRQAGVLVQLGYPAAVGMAEAAFTGQLAPLRERVATLDLPEADLEAGRLPFAVVLTHELVAPEKTMALAGREGGSGFVNLYPRKPGDFVPIDGLRIPDAPVYLLVDIDRGRDTINVTPDEALARIREQGRSPLTIAEGIAARTLFPGFLRKNNCYSLAGSRAGDQRVPAIWISGGRPRLGWCWAGNPHTWLGTASCRERLGP